MRQARTRRSGFVSTALFQQSNFLVNANYGGVDAL